MILDKKDVLFDHRHVLRGEDNSILVGTYLRGGRPTWYRRLNGKQNLEQGKQYILDEGELTYDEGTHSYLAFSAPQNYTQHYHFNYGTRTLYIPFYQQQLIFVVISRNASCCLLATAGKQKGDVEIADRYDEPAIAWLKVRKVALTSLPPELEGYRFAFVYQDPFQRWCQTCNYFMGVNYNKLGAFYIPNRVEREKFLMSRFARLWHFLALCEAEQKFARGAKDQHIMSQLETIGYCPQHLDLVVPLEKLTSFINREIGMVPVTANVETSWWFNPERDVPSSLRERIESLYSEDYDIPKLFEGRFYTGN